MSNATLFNVEIEEINDTLVVEAIQHFNRLSKRPLFRVSNDFKERYFFDRAQAEMVVRRSYNQTLTILPVLDNGAIYCWVVNQAKKK